MWMSLYSTVMLGSWPPAEYQSPISTSHYGSLKQAQLLLSAMSDNFAHQRQFPLIDDLIGAAVLPLSAQRND